MTRLFSELCEVIPMVRTLATKHMGGLASGNCSKHSSSVFHFETIEHGIKKKAQRLGYSKSGEWNCLENDCLENDCLEIDWRMKLIITISTYYVFSSVISTIKPKEKEDSK